MMSPALRNLLATLLLLGLIQCKAPPQGAAGKPGTPKADAGAKPASDPKTESLLPKPDSTADSTESVDMSFLLSMSYAEASTITAAKAELPTARVAADSVEVLRTDAEGKPIRVRARGKVFVEVDFPNGEQARALAQEAYISLDELILRGRPVLQRGTATLEGLTDFTVFFLFGNQVRAIGTHRATNPERLIQDLPTGLPGWDHGPNPLLPPLEPSAVPDSVRAELNAALEAEAARRQALKPLPTGASIPVPDSAKPKTAPKPKR